MNWQRALVGADRPFAIDVAVRSEHVPGAAEVPTIGPRGEIHYGERTAFLNERDALLASVLVFHFESELTDAELLGRVWPEGATWRTLRHSLHRLNRRRGAARARDRGRRRRATRARPATF